jgi:hypothetical protein
VFLFVLIASLAEFPGVILSALIVERLGRKIVKRVSSFLFSSNTLDVSLSSERVLFSVLCLQTTAIFFILCGSSLYILTIFTLDPIVTLILVMSARMFIEGCYAVLWAYSPEVRHTKKRIQYEKVWKQIFVVVVVVGFIL